MYANLCKLWLRFVFVIGLFEEKKSIIVIFISYEFVWCIQKLYSIFFKWNYVYLDRYKNNDIIE